MQDKDDLLNRGTEVHNLYGGRKHVIEGAVRGKRVRQHPTYQ